MPTTNLRVRQAQRTRFQRRYEASLAASTVASSLPNSSQFPAERSMQVREKAETIFSAR
jgi:hypothetical protein